MVIVETLDMVSETWVQIQALSLMNCVNTSIEGRKEHLSFFIVKWKKKKPSTLITCLPYQSLKSTSERIEMESL